MLIIWDQENLKKIVELSDATIYTVAQVAEELKKVGLNCELIPANKFTLGPFELEPIRVAHELIMDNPLPELCAFLVDGKVLHPVDSFDDKLLKYQEPELLILPIMAPFTTEPRVAAFADAIRPKQILPVHDGYAKDFFVKQRYQAYNNHFKKQEILFHQLMLPGNFIEI